MLVDTIALQKTILNSKRVNYIALTFRFSATNFLLDYIMLHSHNQRSSDHPSSSSVASATSATYQGSGVGTRVTPKKEMSLSSQSASASASVRAEATAKSSGKGGGEMGTVALPLLSEWTLWCHLPFRTNQDDWTLGSYKNVYTFSDLKDVMATMETMPDKFFLNSVLFIMRKGVSPMWEDKAHRKGGCFSFKVPNKYVGGVARQLTYAMVGETISNLREFNQNVSGISISPKKGSCTVKIWMCTAEFQNAQCITAPIPNLTLAGCLFSMFETAIETGATKHPHLNTR